MFYFHRLGILDCFTMFCMVSFAIYTVVHFYRQDKLRFSLRTLLIATTLIAAVLGLLVWWARN